MDEVRVYVSHEAYPSADCDAATVVVASSSRMDAVSALRSAGFAARNLKPAATGSVEESAALRQPGVVLWSPWPVEHDAAVWHRK